jgi:hypothetical protein
MAGDVNNLNTSIVVAGAPVTIIQSLNSKDSFFAYLILI